MRFTAPKTPTATDPRFLDLARQVIALETVDRRSNAAAVEALCMEAARLANEEKLELDWRLYQFFDDCDVRLKSAHYCEHQTDQIRRLFPNL
ncbi:MAG TPA: hypothetical protein VF138_04210 [Caulobacteraceae bacterium]